MNSPVSLKPLDLNMGAMLPTSKRLFSMRNPCVRAGIFSLLIIVILVTTMHTTKYDVRSAVINAANTAKSITVQNPLADHKDTSKDTQETEHLQGDAALNTSTPMNCNYDMEHLRDLQDKFNLGEQFEYFKRYIRIERQNVPRKSMTKLKQKFLPGTPKTVEPGHKYWKESCPEPLTVPVSQSPFPQSADLSDFMFGVSTTYKRFNDPRTSSINEWTYWLTNQAGKSNGGKLVLLLLDATDDELYDAYTQLRNVGIDADVFHSDSSMKMAVRYLSLVPTLYNHRERPNKKWLVTCDDDTFFPSPNALKERFDTFDSSSPLYIGTLSEDVNNIDRHGSQAFGGAGVFLSLPVAELVSELYENCKTDEKIREADSGWGPQGDILLRKCIYENSDVRLQLVNELWQLDIAGDPSGFYESGIKPLSLHHYRGGTWHVAYPFHYTKIARLCGEDCTMQRFLTEDDFVISNGFSVAQYPDGADYNWSQMERTFGALPEDKGWNLDFAFGPQRLKLHQTGEKISWDLQSSEYDQAEGTVSQVYVRKANDWRWVDADGWPMSQVDGIIELIWIQ